MEQAVIYSRVSTTSQDYTGQTLELKKYAKYKGIKVVREFEEKASGYNDEIEREEFTKMKAFVVENDISHILCWEISRFSRRTYLALQEIEFFTKHNVNIYFKKEDISSLSDNAFNKVLLTLLSSIAQMEKETMKARHKRGMLRGASQGLAHGLGRIPYGFKKDAAGALLEDVEESKWIRQIYQWRVEGLGTKSIANELNKRGVPTRRTKEGRKRVLKSGEEIGILWRGNTIAKILKSLLYKGKREYFGETFDVPILINNSLWDEVQNTFKEKIGYINRTEYKYLFKGKIRCGKCGLAYLSRTDTKNGNLSSYYFCSGRKDKGVHCNNGQFKAKTLDKYVWLMLASQREFYEEYHKERVEGIDIEQGKTEIKYLQSQIDKAEGKRKRTVATYLEGELDETTYKSELQKIKVSVKQWENEIKDIKDRMKKQSDTVKSLNKGDHFNIRMFLSFDKRRKYVEKWVDKVVLTKYEGEVEGTHGNDQVMKVDLYAFGLSKPKSALISSVSEIMVDL